MNLILLFKKIQPYVKPYRWLVVLTLILTLIGSFIAQINAVVLDKTVDAINELIMTNDLLWKNAAQILTVISIVLLGKEVLSAIITYAQHFLAKRCESTYRRICHKLSSTTCLPIVWLSSLVKTMKLASCRHVLTKESAVCHQPYKTFSSIYCLSS